MEATGQGNINIVHIGGSHVQAGTMSNTIRQRLMHNHPRLVSGRGMLFPYSAAARCNNPADYRVHCPQKVALTRNIYKEYPHPLGLCGISVTASDSLTEVGIVLRDSTVNYATRRIIVLGHSEQGVVPLLNLGGRMVYPSYVDRNTDRHVFNLAGAVDSFVVLLPCRPGEQFTLTGIHLDNLRPGFSFHSIGVNGASVPDYLRSIPTSSSSASASTTPASPTSTPPTSAATTWRSSTPSSASTPTAPWSSSPTTTASPR